MKTYQGIRNPVAGIRVIVCQNGRGHALNPARSLKVWNHSPTGFEWGYGGSGPAQLALAILLDHTGKRQLAVDHHQAFKRNKVSQFAKDGFSITGEEIDIWLLKQPPLNARLRSIL